MTTATLQEWKVYEFTMNGFTFHSRVEIGSDIWHKIATLPAFIFTDMNRDILKEEIKGEWTRENLEREMIRINEHGSQAFIELVEESEA